MAEGEGQGPELKRFIGGFVEEMVGLQAEDGYLGPWSKRSRLTGSAPNIMANEGSTWDAWGHYHIMLGLLLWYEESRDAKALNCAAKMGGLICEKFLGKKRRRLVDTGSAEMNLAIIHSPFVSRHRVHLRSSSISMRSTINRFSSGVSGRSGRRGSPTSKPRCCRAALATPMG